MEEAAVGLRRFHSPVFVARLVHFAYVLNLFPTSTLYTNRNGEEVGL